WNSRMIKKVPVSQLCVGMYVHDLGGSFLDHSFWRSRFLIQNERKLLKLQVSKLEWVLIDTNRGMDVASGGTVVDVPQAPAPASAAAGTAKQGAKAPPPPAPVPLSPEQQAFDDARDIIDGSREQVQQLFAEAERGDKIDLR